MSDASGQARASGVLSAGTRAPDFELAFSPGHLMSLNEWRGRPLILSFYPADFSPVCGDQLAIYNELLGDFGEYDAQLLGISVDGVWCHAAFAQARKLRFPLLSDFEPKGAVSRAYGAYRAKDGTSERALFVIDREGVIRWSHLSDVDVNPGADGILNALARMAHGDGPRAARPEAGVDRPNESRE